MSSIKSVSALETPLNPPGDEYIPGEFSEEPASAGFQDFVPEKIPEQRTTIPPVLIMAAPPPPKPRLGTLMWFAHMLGLDVYGTTTLSYAARTEMIACALVLTIIFLFDAGAWCLLFYFILNSGSLNFHPGLLVLSLAGILPALALLLYERSFMTADTKTHGWRRLVLPTILRVCVIFAAAWMTAQPVELMAFQRRIDRRVMDELIRKDIVGHMQKLQKATDDQKKGDVALKPYDIQELKVAETDLESKGKQVTAAESELEKRKQAKIAAEDRWLAAQSQLKAAKEKAAGDPNSEENQKAVALKQKAMDDAYTAYKDRITRVSEQQGTIGSLNQQVKGLEGKVDKRRETIAADDNAEAGKDAEKKLLLWSDKLRGAEPGKDFPADGSVDKDTGYRFVFADYSFLDKFRIIDDIMAGRPPRWPGAEQDDIKFLQKKYGLYDDHDNISDLKGQARSAAEERLAAETKNARRTYYAVFGVALIIPFMSLLFKIIMPAPLSYYYSSGWQSQQGHAEAMALEAAVYSMKARSRPKSRIFVSKSGTGAV
ncbi:MAG TPA: DUF4407 domain-containing protein [Candidatus Angelobacter sp.]|nr:DUF4407 domain-containing protein [Candidatus Angelobacter sp.]